MMTSRLNLETSKSAFDNKYEMEETKADSMAGTARDEQEMERLGKTQQLNVG